MSFPVVFHSLGLLDVYCSTMISICTGASWIHLRSRVSNVMGGCSCKTRQSCSSVMPCRWVAHRHCSTRPEHSGTLRNRICIAREASSQSEMTRSPNDFEYTPTNTFLVVVRCQVGSHAKTRNETLATIRHLSPCHPTCSTSSSRLINKRMLLFSGVMCVLRRHQSKMRHRLSINLSPMVA